MRSVLRGLLPFLGCGLAAAFVLAAVLVPAPHTGGDNATYLSLAAALLEGEGYTEVWDPDGLPHAKYPPVLPLALAAAALLGAGTWYAFKVLMAGLVGGAVLLVLAWSGGRRGLLAGVVVALLTLLAAGWLDASRWILSEPLFLVLTYLGLLGADRGLGRLPGIGAGADLDQARRGEEGPGRRSAWIIVACAAGFLALFTRSAGLPLVLALLALLAVLRHRTAALALAGAVALGGLGWFLRGRVGSGEGAYQSEFWMVNPYEPELGTIGPAALPLRAWNNLRIYGGEVLPSQWWGGGSELFLLGVALGGLAIWGWTLRMRLGAGAAELFFPLYGGLILVWPEVWSGERFLLPLVPLLLLYAGEAARYAALPLGRLGVHGVLGAGTLLLALPALSGWTGMASQAAECRRLAASGDVFRCHGAGFAEFRDASAWIGANLPDGSVVLNRKPSIHHLLGGRPGRIYPFTTDPDRFLDAADRLGAAYLLFDQVDGISSFYLPAILHGRPGAFCYVAGWGGGGGFPGTDLFGILPPAERRVGGELSELTVCPPGYRLDPAVQPAVEGWRVPRMGGRQSSAVGRP